ncbi:Atp-Dependent Dna Helicase Q5 [Manis pentadactyla]|nr:Atp-Dependent Dna Helicase Q5 [Manis pentadactyla]
MATYDAVGGTDDGLGPTFPTGPHTRMFDSPLPASCTPQTTTTQAVIVLSPLDPHNAMGGTDDGHGPTAKSDDDPMGTPPTSEKAPKIDPRPQTRPWDVQTPDLRQTLMLKTNQWK